MTTISLYDKQKVAQMLTETLMNIFLQMPRFKAEGTVWLWKIQYLYQIEETQS